MAKKLLIALVAVYLIVSFFVPMGEAPDKKGRNLVLLSYATFLVGILILKKTNGEGLRFKTYPFQNPLTRADIFKFVALLSFAVFAVAVLLSIFAYNKKNLSYMYDFITLVIALLIIWNAMKLKADKIEQDSDKKLNSTPLKKN